MSLKRLEIEFSEAALFRIKVCGITSVQDAGYCLESGVGAIGLNFWPGSPRCIDLATARRIVDFVQGRLVVVGVFVDADLETVRSTCDGVPLDMVQLHGNEPPEFALYSTRPVIKAFRLGLPATRTPQEYCAAFQAAWEKPRERHTPLHGGPGGELVLLLDSFVPALPGGSGVAADLVLAKSVREALPGSRVVLAGGLTPDSVDFAIRSVHPDAVDVASGVEVRPGAKSLERIAAFAAAALRAFEDLEQARKNNSIDEPSSAGQVYRPQGS